MNSPKPLQRTRSDAQLLQFLLEPQQLQVSAPIGQPSQLRLIRLEEINDAEHAAFRQALSNVYATLNPDEDVRMVYLLDGHPDGVALYFGVVSDNQAIDIHEAMKNFRGALEGQLPGIIFSKEPSKDEITAIAERLQAASHQGLVLGAPTGQDPNQAAQEMGFQGVDRIVRALQSGCSSDTVGASHWQLTVVSQALPRETIYQQLDDAYKISSQLANMVRTSVQEGTNESEQKSHSYGTSTSKGSNEGESKNWGTSTTGAEGKSGGKNSGSSSGGSSSSTSSGSNSGWSQTKTLSKNEGTSTNTGRSYTQGESENSSLSRTTGSSISTTRELSDKRAQHLMDHLDKRLVARLQKGLTKGLFQTAVYLSAEDKSTYERLKNTVRATFQGTESTLSPLSIQDLDKAARGHLLQLPKQPADQPLSSALLFHSMHHDRQGQLGSLMTADELAIVASLPECELLGVRRRKTVDFIVDIPLGAGKAKLDLGEVIDRGRRYPNNRVRLVQQDLNKHTFITGVTGAGKTTTCLNLLLESGLPFLVIEPAKTEYRELAPRLPQINYYRPNGDAHQSLRINPFALLRRDQRIKSHAGFIKNVFAAIFPMEASMPMMVEAAILAAYEEKGWDLEENQYLSEGDPFDPQSRAWPTMSDMIRQLDGIIASYGLGKEFEEKYRGSLVSRLRSLTDGTLGSILDVPQSIDFQALLQRRAVIELEALQSGEEKALLMALLLGGLNEAIRDLHAQDPNFRHLTLIEEAHRLLSRPEPGDKAAAMAVESFADMLAEVRKYGAGLIIADQIPAKLIPDVIKNTHTKIVHRLFAEDDRRAMGEAMMMDDEQRAFLPNLGTGEAIVFCGGWHGPCHAAIRNDRAQTDNARRFDLNDYSKQQLWQERHRYYPLLAALPWFAQDDTATQEQFVQFAKETKQAMNLLLRLLGDEKAPNNAGFYARLQNWQAQWQPHADAAQADYAQWRQTQPPTVQARWPESLLAAACCAFVFDANPKTKPEVKNPPSLHAANTAQVFASGLASLLQILGEQDYDGWKKRRNSSKSDPNPKLVAEQLVHYKHF